MKSRKINIILNVAFIMVANVMVIDAKTLTSSEQTSLSAEKAKLNKEINQIIAKKNLSINEQVELAKKITELRLNEKKLAGRA